MSTNSKMHDTVRRKIPLSFTDKMRLLIMLIFFSSWENVLSILSILVTKCLSVLYILSISLCYSVAISLCIWMLWLLCPSPRVWMGWWAGKCVSLGQESRQQGVQTVSLVSVFLLLRWHREIQAVRQQAVYENTAVRTLPGLLSHQPIFIAMYAVQSNGVITTNEIKINCNSFKITILILVHPVFFILVRNPKPQLDIWSSLIGALEHESQGSILSSSDIDVHNIDASNIVIGIYQITDSSDWALSFLMGSAIPTGGIFLPRILWLLPIHNFLLL